MNRLRMKELAPRVLPALIGVMISACEPMPASSQQPEQMGTQSHPKRGWIESKREITPPGIDARVSGSYEYTARMGDGSSHVFREEMPASWRVGERLIYIPGSDPLNAK
ncbi:MAG: hypothetical protein ACJ8G4_07165 [Burkholderiales bacterium]